MRCPYCKKDKDKVVDSRSGEDGNVTRRRRECLLCGKRFTTYERLEDGRVRVVKKGGEREPFDRGKIRDGVVKACWNLPVSDQQIDGVVGRIERGIQEANEREVASRRIGELVMEELRMLNQVAYVRFASVYREFKDVTEFMQVLQEFMHGARKDEEGDPQPGGKTRKSAR